MPGKYILDTTIIIAYRANEAGVHAAIDGADEVFIPVISVGELEFGARKSGRTAYYLDWLDRFTAAIVVLECTSSSARHYGMIRDQLRRRGEPIPENDLWIAAIALENDLTLATRDAHFASVDGLRIESW